MLEKPENAAVDLSIGIADDDGGMHDHRKQR
jgi:hypothetical protein